MAEALIAHGTLSKSQVVWDCSFNWEVNYLLKLNTGERPIANKYCEGKMKRCLKRQSKVPEIVERESIVISVVFGYFPIHFFRVGIVPFDSSVWVSRGQKRFQILLQAASALDDLDFRSSWETEVQSNFNLFRDSLLGDTDLNDFNRPVL